MAAKSRVLTHVIEKLSPAMLLNILVCLEEEGLVTEYDLDLFRYKNDVIDFKISQDQKNILEQYFTLKRLRLISQKHSGFSDFEELLRLVVKSLYINQAENKIKALHINFLKRNELARDISGYIKLSHKEQDKRKACFKRIIDLLTEQSDFQRIRFLSYSNIILIFFLNPTNMDFLYKIRKHYLTSNDVNLYYSPYPKFGEYEINLFLEYDLSEHPFIEKLRTLKYFDNHLVLITKNKNQIYMELFNKEVVDKLLVLGSFGSYGFTPNEDKSTISCITEKNIVTLDYIKVPISLRNKDEYLRRLKAHIEDTYRFNERKNELADYYPPIPEESFIIIETDHDKESIKEELSIGIKQIINMLDDKFITDPTILKGFQILLQDFDKKNILLIHLDADVINNIGCGLIMRCLKLKFPALIQLDRLKNKAFAKIFIQHNFILRPDIKHFSNNYLEFIKRLGLKNSTDVMLIFKSANDRALLINQKWFDKKNLTLLDYMQLEMENINNSLNIKRFELIKKLKRKIKPEKSLFSPHTIDLLKDIVENSEEKLMQQEIDSLFVVRKELWDIIYKRGALLDLDIEKYNNMILEYERYASLINDIESNMRDFGRSLSQACDKIIDMEQIFNKRKANQTLKALKGNPLGINLISDRLFSFLKKKKLQLPPQQDILNYIFNKLHAIHQDLNFGKHKYISVHDLMRVKSSLKYFKEIATAIINKIEEIIK